MYKIHTPFFKKNIAANKTQWELLWYVSRSTSWNCVTTYKVSFEEKYRSGQMFEEASVQIVGYASGGVSSRGLEHLPYQPTLNYFIWLRVKTIVTGSCIIKSTFLLRWGNYWKIRQTDRCPRGILTLISCFKNKNHTRNDVGLIWLQTNSRNNTILKYWSNFWLWISFFKNVTGSVSQTNESKKCAKQSSHRKTTQFIVFIHIWTGSKIGHIAANTDFIWSSIYKSFLFFELIWFYNQE